MFYDHSSRQIYLESMYKYLYECVVHITFALKSSIDDKIIPDDILDITFET